MTNTYVSTFDLRKKNKENFVKENSRFLDSGIVKTCDELDLSKDKKLKSVQKYVTLILKDLNIASLVSNFLPFIS